MTDTPITTGLASLVAEAKDVETKLEALLTPTPVSAAPSASLSSPPPVEPVLSPSQLGALQGTALPTITGTDPGPPVPPGTPLPPNIVTDPGPPVLSQTAPAPAAAPAATSLTPAAVASAENQTLAASSMVISNEPIAAPPDAIPVPAAPAAPIQSSALDAAAAIEQARITKLENEKNAFYQAVLDARKQGIPPAIVTPPIPERIRTQTELEKAAGAAAVAVHAAAQGRRIIQATALPTDGTMTPVFRPDDFVPDQRKGQGNVTSTILT
jgi:hypothetical protein